MTIHYWFFGSTIQNSKPRSWMVFGMVSWVLLGGRLTADR
jgi:hypothetical protein